MSSSTRGSVAVIGAGVSGLTAAHVLSVNHDVTVHEAESRLGGHAHTHDVTGADGETLRVDSGFIVHNDRTYPVLRRLFTDLGVVARPTEMSMSIQDEASGIAYAGGRGVQGFLARPRQLLDGDYLTMLRAVRRFHRDASAFLDESAPDDLTTYGEFIRSAGLPEAFTRLYAVPLVACVWSTEVGRALDYPARHLFAFLRNHGMLSIGDSPQWFTVEGGSRTYVDALAQRLVSKGATIRTGCGVRGILRHADGVEVTDDAGRTRLHDRVVIATHSDTALALLADATPAEKDVLGAIRYTSNETVLHADPSLLPRNSRLRSSWNYVMPAASMAEGAGPSTGTGGLPIVTYWMNKLQGHPESSPLLVTLNAADRIDPALVLARMDYSHPLFDVAALRAQHRLPELTTDRTAFAGAYHGWGFHEDGARAGLAAAEAFGARWSDA